MKDFLGNEITVGCKIIYGAALGRCAALAYAEVLEVITEVKDQYREPKKLKVRRIRSQHTPGYERLRWDEDLSKPVYLGFPDRCVVVS